MKPVMIEFLGTQGSGKTSLLPVVVAFFREQGLQTFTVTEAARPYARRTLLGKMVDVLAPAAIREKLLWQVYYQTSVILRSSFRNKHRSLVRFVDRTQRSRPETAGVRDRRVLFWFSHLTGTYAFLERYAHENEAIVFDDGFVHRTVHLNASPVEIPKRENIIEYLSSIPLPDLLIVPRVTVDMCVARVKSRGVWDHFRGKTQDELRRYLANSEFIVDVAVSELRKQGCFVIEVDNSHADIQKTIVKLHEELDGVEFSRSDPHSN